MKYFIPLVLAMALVGGCKRSPSHSGPPYGGMSLSSYGNADHATNTSIITQYDTNHNLLFVVAWTNKLGAGGAEMSDRNLLTKIHGKEVHPSLTRQAIYALQSNGTLVEIAISDEDRRAIFAELINFEFHVNDSDLWQRTVAPKLDEVDK